MANRHLSLKPYNLPRGEKGEETWLYEERGGLAVMCQIAVGRVIGVGTIPWRKIRAALKRKDKPHVSARAKDFRGEEREQGESA